MIVVGRINDVMLYRELTRRGVSDYLIAPVGTLDIVRAICGLFSSPDAKPVGRIIAVVGAKGGVGASTVAHNIAWAIARDLALDSVVTDLDLAFGTAGLDYNQDPPQGIADAVFSPDRIDTAFVDRLLSKCTDHLSLLAAPATLDRVYDFGAEAFDADPRFAARHRSLRRARRAASCGRAGPSALLVSADDILIVAAPDLANLRNAKNMVDLLRAARPNDHRPYLLPQPGRRAEAAGNRARRFRQGAGRRAGRRHPVRAATVRHRRQQRPDDRRSVGRATRPRRCSASSAQVLTGRAEVKRARSEPARRRCSAS